MELYRIENLQKSYVDSEFRNTKTVAIQNLSTIIYQEQITAIVGESGSGKSTLGMILAGLEKASAGEVFYKNEKLTEAFCKKEYQLEVQMIFQNPFDAINPRWKIEDALIEGIRYHKIIPRKQEKEYILDIVKSCGLDEELLKKKPNQLSGGQLQRMCIARILALKPKVLIADEIVTALDAGVQAKILDLLLQMQKKYKFSLIFISHDLAVVRRIAHRIIVMKDGEIIEEGMTEEIFKNPKKEYTKELIAAIPKFEIGKTL